MLYNLFIGRYQSPHKGHQTIFNTYLDKGLPILIAIRDTPIDEKNPLSAFEVKSLWEKVYENNDLVKVIVIPDIASVNYGRGVGYDVNEIKVDTSIANISATQIRDDIRSNNNSWKEFVDEKIWGDLENLFNHEQSK
jgi:nicotinic acid mononucleotide adenylyltransferase